jgi:hypothetical protein
MNSLRSQSSLPNRSAYSVVAIIAICRGFVEAQHEYAEEKRGINRAVHLIELPNHPTFVPFDRDLIAYWNLDRAEAQTYVGSREGAPD